MSVFEEVYKYIGWKNKRRDRPPKDLEVVHRWIEPQFPHALKKLRRMRGEKGRMFHTLWLYELGGKPALAVTRHRKERESAKEDKRRAGIPREAIFGREEEQGPDVPK